MFRTTPCLIAVLLLSTTRCYCQVAAESRSFPDRIHAAVERSLPLLEIASAETANRRACFTCHGQAMPAIVLAEAQEHGFHIDDDNWVQQLDHTYAHLQRSQKQYAEGRGTGGQVDTAGWALWALEAGQRAADDVTDPVVEYLLGKQHENGSWDCSSNRPPSEKSDFATTYVAIRGLQNFGRPAHQERVQRALKAVEPWLHASQPNDTEDRVFQLLSLLYLGLNDEAEKRTQELSSQQRADGGWAQLPAMQSDAYATATVLYALAEAGIGITEESFQRGIEYLLRAQADDGSWHVASRSKPFQSYFETGYPHQQDQFISTTAACWATLVLLRVLPEETPAAIETLAGTQPLSWPESDLSGRLMIGAHRFVESRIAAANEQRHQLKMDDSSQTSLRSELRTVLGVVEERLPPRLEQFGHEADPALVAETDRYRVYQVRWPVFANVFGEGLWVQQKVSSVGSCVVVPDADQSPEQLLGLADGLDADQQIAKRLAANGLDLIIPAIISRNPIEADSDQRAPADMAAREWIYRQAFHMGRHVIGYDLQRVFAAVDCLFSPNTEKPRIGIVGYGEGGLIALHAAAIDDRIDSALVSGYFTDSDAAWSEPIYRNVWRRSWRLGNAEVASLIAPRELVIEHSEFPTVTGHKGHIVTPPTGEVQAEFERIRNVASGSGPLLVLGDNDAPATRWSDKTLKRFFGPFGVAEVKTSIEELEVRGAESTSRIAQRQVRCTDQAEQHVQTLVRQSDRVRDDFFLHQASPALKQQRWSTERTHDIVADPTFVEATERFRERFVAEAMGRFDMPLLPPDTRTRKVAETDKWTAYDVVLNVHESLFAWGTLLIPKDLKPGERRPVVVCQHGRNGIPRDTIDSGNPAYNDFAAALAERGFITLAPHNLYRGEDKYRWLDRKANAIGCTLFSFIIASHEQMLRWLDSLPFVDGERIAFYGLSYGGETAVRVPSALPKYCLSICSGDFNQWTRKVASTDQPFSFMRTIEWEMPYWNLGHTFDYAEMAYLMYPRPFMVERGHHDGVGRDHWVAYEFAKVRWLYAQFGKADRVDIEFFQGGHSINGQGSFDFLHEHLNWPAPQQSP